MNIEMFVIILILLSVFSLGCITKYSPKNDVVLKPGESQILGVEK